MGILNAVARWPGSTHDSFIVRNSSVGNRLEAGAGRDGWLLGDRGYPLKPWLLTPIAHPQTAEEVHYNTVHARARSVVERTRNAEGKGLLLPPHLVYSLRYTLPGHKLSFVRDSTGEAPKKRPSTNLHLC
ncbi:hypothetical protein QQF64_012074 [Cirrhinus molitorella]|uniref:DDE Tnp4 domain-containing protein n=1 Tax=Cirrhinus molitorella TaxID=172907 RepID=A0ABR3LXW6_9TELE